MIKVDENKCIGCGACVAIDSEHFAFNDEGLSHPISEENLESANLQNALNSCPTCAISISEEDDTTEEATNNNNTIEETGEDDDTCCGNCEHCQHEEA